MISAEFLPSACHACVCVPGPERGPQSFYRNAYQRAADLLNALRGTARARHVAETFSSTRRNAATPSVLLTLGRRGWSHCGLSRARTRRSPYEGRERERERALRVGEVRRTAAMQRAELWPLARCGTSPLRLEAVEPSSRCGRLILLMIHWRKTETASE